MRTLFYISLGLLIVSSLSCGDGLHDDYDVNGKPIELFLEGTELKSTPYLKIKKPALGQEFMFYGSFIPMLNSPTGHSLKGRIIRFEQMADRVIMLESPKGHTILSDAESTILLAEFPIVQTEGDGVVIDFAKGMTSAFTSRNVHSQSVADKGSGTSEQFRAIFLTASFIKSISLDETVLTIRQIAQWRNAKAELVSAEFRYFFREYAPSPDFKKKVFSKNRHVQYFSTPPQITGPTTETSAFITKWSLEKPLVFYISSNTPPQFKEGIRDGLLFWNHIFGKKIIEVRDLPEHLSAPHPHLNIVQWVLWDNEASAYADMVVDHLTGEALQAQIYLRSGWIIKSAKKLRTQLAELLFAKPDEEHMAPIENGTPMPTMFDYEEPHMDSLTDYEALIELIESLNTQEITDTTLTLLTSDIIRTVIAHEMGHVLGLRHNLGSSVTSNISLKERAHYLKEYLLSGASLLGSEKRFSQSIMDVFSAADDALMGSQIREFINSDIETSPLKAIYSYDLEAINFGYFDIPMKGDTPFCTDDDLQRYLDCQRWDISSTPLQYAASRLNSLPLQVSVILSETFIAAFNPKRPGGALHAKDIPLSNAALKKTADMSMKQLFYWFNRNARSIQIEAQNPMLGVHNFDEMVAKRFSAMREELTSANMQQLLFGLTPPFRPATLENDELIKNFSKQFVRMIAQAQKNDPEFVVSDEDIKDTLAIAEAFFKQLNTELMVQLCSIVGHMQFDDPLYQEPIEDALGKIAQAIILSKDSSSSPLQPGLPVFRYNLVARDTAAQLLNPALGILSDWSFDSLSLVSNQLKAIMREAIGQGNATTGIDLSTMVRQKRQWLLDQNKILNTLTRMKSLTRAIGPTL